MRIQTTLRNAVAALAAATLAACGGSSTPSSEPAKINVRLVDAPSSGYQEVNIDVQKVEIAGDDGWRTLGTPNRVVNLLALVDGVSATLVDGETLPAGHYGQMRLVLGTRNSVLLTNGTSPQDLQDLKVPSGQQSGVKLTVNFDVQPGTTADVYIDFDAHKSVFVHEAGNSGKYLLRPTVRACDKLVTGSISGTLTTGGTTAVPVGTVVTAQTLAGDVPTVVRSALTKDKGQYLLDLVPLGKPVYVVAQPVLPAGVESSATACGAKASDPITLTAASPFATYDADFPAASAAGGIEGAILPAAVSPQVDTVEALLALEAGGAPHTFVVRSTNGAVSGGVETYAMPLLPVTSPATTYTLLAQRRGLDSTTGMDKVTVLPAVLVPVTASATTPVNFTFP